MFAFFGIIIIIVCLTNFTQYLIFAKFWPTANGKVVKIEKVSRSDSEFLGWFDEFTFEYEFKGKKYESKCLKNIFMFFSNDERINSRLKPGDEVVIRCNPRNPKKIHYFEGFDINAVPFIVLAIVGFVLIWSSWNELVEFLGSF